VQFVGKAVFAFVALDAKLMRSSAYNSLKVWNLPKFQNWNYSTFLVRHETFTTRVSAMEFDAIQVVHFQSLHAKMEMHNAFFTAARITLVLGFCLQFSIALTTPGSVGLDDSGNVVLNPLNPTLSCFCNGIEFASVDDIKALSSRISALESVRFDMRMKLYYALSGYYCELLVSWYVVLLVFVLNF